MVEKIIAITINEKCDNETWKTMQSFAKEHDIKCEYFGIYWSVTFKNIEIMRIFQLMFNEYYKETL